jgi:2-polyprenyl-6-methoxyphenol hydroxylase-like FAD-dependent oxidoreductase
MEVEGRTDVLVVGAGPVGMFTALCLAERGVHVRIVDQYARSTLHSYALALHPHSLRLLDERGLAAELIQVGQKLQDIAVHHSGGTATIDFAPLGGDHPYVLVVSQVLLEAALERRLGQAGVTVAWGHQALTFEAGPAGVTALVAAVSAERPGADLETGRIHATFLVGADGEDSMIRRVIGFPRDGLGDPIDLALMEFETPLAEPRRLHLVLGSATTDVLWPLGSERGRWGVDLAGHAEGVDVTGVRERVRARAPWFGDAFGAVHWLTVVRFRRALARRFGRGPVWLVGDAARFGSPIGVQSMNVGLREAHDLARRIAAILREGRSPKLLDYYNEDRQREWKMLLGIKDRVGTLAGAAPWARAVAGRLVASLPASGHDLNVLLEQVGLRLRLLRGRAAREAGWEGDR